MMRNTICIPRIMLAIMLAAPAVLILAFRFA